MALLDHDAEAVDGEVTWHRLKRTPCEKLKRRFRRLVRVAGGFARLNRVQQRGNFRIILVDDNSQPLDGRNDARPAGLLGHEETTLVAYTFG